MRSAIVMGAWLMAGLYAAATVAETVATNAAPVPATASAERVLKPQTVRVALSAAGAVVSATAAADVPPSIRSILESAVRRWQFSPRQVDGLAISSWVNASVSLAAVAVDGQYRLRVTHVVLADYSIENMVAPNYPSEQVRAGRGATVCMQVDVKDGVQSVAGLWVDRKPAAKTDPFARSARKALQAWQVTSVDPSHATYTGTLMIPLNFTTGDKAIPGSQVDEASAPEQWQNQCNGLVPESTGRARLLSKPEGTLL